MRFVLITERVHSFCLFFCAEKKAKGDGDDKCKEEKVTEEERKLREAVKKIVDGVSRTDTTTEKN